jgi:hypothetical protein
VITPFIEGAERTTERTLLVRLEESLDRGERVVGLDRTLEPLARGRVGVLMIAQDARLAAGQYPRCGQSDALTQHGSIAALARVETNSPETNSPPTKEATHAWSTHTLGSIRRAERAENPL